MVELLDGFYGFSFFYVLDWCKGLKPVKSPREFWRGWSIDVGFSVQDAGNGMGGWRWCGELLQIGCGLELWAENYSIFSGWTSTLHVLCKARVLIAFWATMSISACITPWFEWEVPFWYSSLLDSGLESASTVQHPFMLLGILGLSQNMTGFGFFNHFRLGFAAVYHQRSAGLGAGDFLSDGLECHYPLLQIVDGPLAAIWVPRSSRGLPPTPSVEHGPFIDDLPIQNGDFL